MNRRRPVTLTHSSAVKRSSPRGSPSFLLCHYFVAPGFKLRAWKPGRKSVCLRNLIADFEEQPNVLNGAREVPRRIHFVGDLMIMTQRVVVAFLLTIIGRLTEVIFRLA